MWRFIPIFVLAGCAEIKAPQPVSFPSVCWGEGKENCERRLHAQTLANMGFHDAGLVLLCSDPQVGLVLEVECGSSTLPNP